MGIQPGRDNDMIAPQKAAVLRRQFQNKWLTLLCRIYNSHLRSFLHEELYAYAYRHYTANSELCMNSLASVTSCECVSIIARVVSLWIQTMASLELDLHADTVQTQTSSTAYPYPIYYVRYTSPLPVWSPPPKLCESKTD